ncbi:unnamed protein product [Penicillium salamii]|nr:unnamed protein product [Penicillium salamii]
MGVIFILPFLFPVCTMSLLSSRALPCKSTCTTKIKIALLTEVVVRILMV